MGAIAAAFDKKDSDAKSIVSIMLKELKHRETGNPIVVSQSLAFVGESMRESEEEKTPAKAAIGVNSSEPILGESYMLAIEGGFFTRTSSLVHQVMHDVARQPLKNAGLIIKRLEGSYTFAVAFCDRVIVGRDAMGTRPLYYGENEAICAVATERKALWRLGVTDVHSFPAGNLSIMNQRGFTFEPISVLKPLSEKKMDMMEAAKQLKRLLVESIRDRVSDVQKVAVAFSGGLDSGVVGSLAKRLGSSVRLICVGLEEQHEVEHAKDAAETLELPLTLQTYTVEDVERVLPKVLWLIEEPNVMKAGVAVPFYWTAEVAAKLGYRVLLAGQGADELFGGYRRYLNDFKLGGVQRVQDALFHDAAMSYETNFQRDEPVCAYNKVELRLPFVDTRVVRFALSLPLSLKIKSAYDSSRKQVLRQVARDIGIPSIIADKPKKAVQFATGVDKAIRKLAKRESLTESSYIGKIFRKVYTSQEVKGR